MIAGAGVYTLCVSQCVTLLQWSNWDGGVDVLCLFNDVPPCSCRMLLRIAHLRRARRDATSTKGCDEHEGMRK